MRLLDPVIFGRVFLLRITRGFIIFLFMYDLLGQFKKTVVESELVQPGDKLLIGLSGGPDSTALLHLFTRIREQFDLTLGAVYVNHRLRIKAALKEEQFCQRLCDRWGVELDIASENIRQLAKQKGQSVEEAAREFRYDLFEALALDEGYDRVAVGHNRDDQAETILFRIIRGTGPDGLTGIPIKRGKIIRPLLNISKAEILDYLRSNKINFCHDRSNDSIKMSRNLIRHRIIPVAKQRLNPKVDEALVRLSELIRLDLRLIDRIVKEAARHSVQVTPGGKFELVLSRFNRYDGAVKRRLIRFCLRELLPTNTLPDREVVERLIDLIEQPGLKISLPGRLTAINEAGKLTIYRQARLVFKQPLELGKVAQLACPRLVFSARAADGGQADIIRRPNSQKMAIDLARVSLPLVVRSIRAGDKFRPLGMRGTKKISDFLIDTKCPAHLRDEIPLVCDQKGIIWVAGRQIDDRVKITTMTKRVLFLEFRRKHKNQA